ncbi:glutamate racemase [Thomasclavelia spiroformis]|uniref:glutamate racemase n=1 Tax=Thomasclavelia spiroformis TaxID=29348 RepID=UPI00241F8BF7|nr:glutamate racemase [Thomasclavelia spiroformis]
MERAIGVFDSGVGGLTVLNSIKSLLPNENIIYIGDNYHCPYGDKTPAQLFKYASGIVEYFIKQNVKLIVLACNTTSSTVLERLQMTYPEVMIIGVIDATVNDFINRKVANTLIIATVATIKSNKYPETIKQIDSKIETFSLATPKLVPLVESGKYKEGIYDVLHEYLDEYKERIQSIILGCTHYPILKEQIENVLPNIEYVSSSEAISKSVKDILSKKKLLNLNKNNYIKIYTTGDVDEFIYSSSGFFDYTNLKVEHLIID